jgi:hypothetical protein
VSILVCRKDKQEQTVSKVATMNREKMLTLNTDELCAWLTTHPTLEDEYRKDALKCIRKHLINGRSFIGFSLKDWIACDLSGGAAFYLVELSAPYKSAPSSERQSSLGKRNSSTSNRTPHFIPFRMKKRKLSVSSWPASSDFSDYRSSNFPYVDKTKLLQKLIDKRHVFLSRPRRFGKTLLVNTLNELFLGHKEFFVGLDIENSWDWEMGKYPVIKLDFSDVGVESFEKHLLSQLIAMGTEYGIAFDSIDMNVRDVFDHLTNALCKLNEQEERDPDFVLLIDEYDKPVIDSFDAPEMMVRNLRVLSTFLQYAKAKSPIFSLVTGSSRLARSAIFSGDNVRIDISFDSEFNALCGFSQKEIEESLQPILGDLKLDELKIWYNGYCFGGREGIYNPYSIANAIVHQKVSSYWVNSGNTRLLADFCGTGPMRSFMSDFVLSDFIKIDFKTLLESEDTSTLGKSSNSLCRLFLQSGYLTMTTDSDQSGVCKLCVPNKEIQDAAFSGLMIAGLTQLSSTQCHTRFDAFAKAVQSKDMNSVYDSVFELFQVIGYPDRGKIDKYEDYYQRILQAFFLAICPSVRIEERTSIGKSDVFADFGSWKILFELKVADGEKMGNLKVDLIIADAFEQAKVQYAKGLVPDVICVLVFNTSTRTLFPRESLGVAFHEKQSSLSLPTKK